MIKNNGKKPAFILFVFMMYSIFYFWTSSRYPGLAEKVVLSDAPILSSIGFFPLYEIDPNDPLWKRTALETVNWANTNKKGMSFAFVLGAFILSLMPLLRRRKSGNGFKDSLYGLIIGAPLGVCVNCAAPIARSFYGAGSSIQTSLATLIASPSLNVVVLFMAFSMFPLYLVGTKIAMTFLFILFIIPSACHFWFGKEVAESLDHDESLCLSEESDESLRAVTGWSSAFVWAMKTYFKNFLYLLKLALPLMIFAGFLGALLTNVLPWTDIQTLGQQKTLAVTGMIMLVISLFGSVLPAPMAFDVILSSALLHAGVPVHYVAVFLVTLGAFSIYAFFIVWRSMSLRIAVFLFLTNSLLGVAAGGIAYGFEWSNFYHAQLSIQERLANGDDFDAIKVSSVERIPFERIAEKLNKPYSDAYKKLDIELREGLAVEANAYISTAVSDQSKLPLYSHIKSEDLGLQRSYEISYVTGMVEALSYTTMSVATGDVHNDGWPDIVMTGDMELQPNLVLYANINGERFEGQYVPVPHDVNEIVLVTMADFNGDNWRDIFIAAQNGKNYILYNDRGDFSPVKMVPVFDENIGTIMSVSLADVELDGDLDLFLGNWSVGPRFSNFSTSRNYLMTQEGPAQYKPHKLPGITGETLTSIFADFNNDGYPDLYVGNDYSLSEYSDVILYNDKFGNLVPRRFKEFRPVGAQSTMSIDIGDIDNDLVPDFYIGQIAFQGDFEKEMKKITKRQILYMNYCSENHDLPPEQCEREMKLKYSLAAATSVSDACEWLEYEEDKIKCYIHLVSYKQHCRFQVDAFVPENANVLNIASARYKDFCNLGDVAYKEEQFMPGYFGDPDPEYYLRSDNASLRNVLLNGIDDPDMKLPALTFDSVAQDRSVSYGGWTWNSRFADVDNDGWQDLYLVNGHTFQMALSTNILYRNKGDGYFEDVTKESGLENHAVTTAYSFFDFDNDGDLDIINVPMDAPLQFYRNNNPQNNKAVDIVLHDKVHMNTQGVGAKIVIYYNGANGQENHQMRMIKVGGGSKSYDQTMAHFGLGSVESIKRVEVTWPDGSVDRIDGKLASNHKYRIIREKE